MKFIHLSDLHLGKRVNGFSMLEDQTYILKKILQIIDEEHPDAVVIAGDVYDKSVPSAEAVTLLDDFLWRLAKRNLPVLLIAGNHDSAERLAFGGRLLDSRNDQAPDGRRHHDACRKAVQHPLNTVLQIFSEEEHAGCSGRGADKGDQQSKEYGAYFHPNQPYRSASALSTDRQV